MSDQPEPRWDLLPWRPAEFFGLAGEYDLTDLKRRYNAFVRRYKPERHPAEFQKIRGAFERLQDALRYGADDDADAWMGLHDRPAPLPPPAGLPPRTPSPQTPAPRPTDGEAGRERMPAWLDAAPPEAIHAELRRRVEKSPYDFYALAVLSDLAQDDRLAFALWLLAGLRERGAEGVPSDRDSRGEFSTAESGHPRHAGLGLLLREYFGQPLPLSVVEELAWITTRFIRGDWYYWITEPLWLRLLAVAPFERFRALLARCESRLLDARSEYRVSFYLRLLPPAVWKADEAWLRESLDWVEQACHDVGFRANHPFQAIELLSEYREHRTAFVRTHPICTRIDRALEDYYSAGPVEADRAVIDCQQYLDAQGLALLDAIPSGKRACARGIAVWQRVSDEVMERIGEPEVWSERVLTAEARRLAMELQLKSNRHEFTASRVVVLLGFCVGALVAAGIFLYSSVRLVYHLAFVQDWWGALGDVLQIVGVVVAAVLGLAFVLLALELDERREYRKVFRPALSRFLRSARASVEELIEALSALHGQKVDEVELKVCKGVAERLERDAALALHAAVQRFLRCAADAGGGEDADRAELLAEYRGNRFAFLNGDPVRERIDRLLQGQLHTAQADADREFRDLQRWLVEHPRELIRALPYGCRHEELVLRLWQFLAADVGNRAAARAPAADDAGLQVRVSVLIGRLIEGDSYSRMRVVDRLAGGALMFVLLHTLVGAVWTGYLTVHHTFAGDAWPAVAMLSAFGGVIAASVGLLGIVLFARGWYEVRWYPRWRAELFSLMAVEDRPLEDVRQEIRKYGTLRVQNRKFYHAERLAELMRGDGGLEIYAIARRFAG